MDSLVGATEQMRWRDEREWRFIARLTDTAKKTFAPDYVAFVKNDVDELICPKSDVPAVQQIADKVWGHGHGVQVKAL